MGRPKASGHSFSCVVVHLPTAPPPGVPGGVCVPRRNGSRRRLRPPSGSFHTSRPPVMLRGVDDRLNRAASFGRGGCALRVSAKGRSAQTNQANPGGKVRAADASRRQVGVDEKTVYRDGGRPLLELYTLSCVRTVVGCGGGRDEVVGSRVMGGRGGWWGMPLVRGHTRGRGAGYFACFGRNVPPNCCFHSKIHTLKKIGRAHV